MTVTLDQTVLERGTRKCHPVHEALLTSEELDLMYGNDEGAKRRYVEENMTSEDVKVTDPRDLVVCAISFHIAQKEQQRINDFYQYSPTDPNWHMKMGIQWVKQEEEYLEKRLGRKPTSEEFNRDHSAKGNGYRHRIALMLEYPDAYRKR